MNDTPTTWQKAVTFSRLHVPGDPIVLPNAWDPVSAQVIASTGARDCHLLCRHLVGSWTA